MDYFITALTAFTVYHLLLGGLALLILTVVFKCLRISAESQNWLWITAFVIACSLPFTLFIQSPSPIAVTQNSPQVNPQVEELSQIESETGTGQNMDVTAIGQDADEKLTLTLSDRWVYWFTPWFVLLLCIWVSGCGWRVAGIVQSLIRTRQLIRSSRPYLDVELSNELSRCEVRISQTRHSPMVAGLLRPVIILPLDLIRRLDASQLRPIILHEWAHIRRRDLWTIILQESLAIAFWWSPVVRLLNRRIHVTRELACDIRAARVLANPKQYAQCLLECARLMVTRRYDVLAMGMFSKKQDLNQRVDHVMKMQTGKVHNGFLSVVACLVLAIAGFVVATEVDQKIEVAKPKQLSPLNVGEVTEDYEKAQRSALENNAVIIKMSPESAKRLKQEKRLEELKARELAMRNRNIEPLSLKQLKAKTLLEVVQRGDRDSVAQLLSEGIDINTAVPRDGTALIVAAKLGKTDMVSYLIQMGADVNQAVQGDGNALIGAAIGGHTDVAAILCDAGAEVNGIVPGDETPLINASRFGRKEMAEFLIDRGADVNLGVEVQLRNGETAFRSPLNQASSDEMREYLISMGAQ